MTNPKEELRLLLASCRMLMRSILTVSHEDDDPRGWPVRIRAAQRHVNDAVASLNHGPGQKHGRLGSLDRMAASLTTSLVNDIMVEADRQTPGDMDRRVSPLYERDGFHGYTWAIPLPDLLGFLQMQQKTGVLRVNTGEEVISLVFDAGDLIHASSDNSPPGARLGEILVANKAIDQPRLEAFLIRYRNEAGYLGDALQHEGLISSDHLRLALDHQVELIFQRLFQSHSAYYAFRAGHTQQAIGIRRNVCQLLLETSRLHDEAGRGGEPSSEAA